MTIAERDAIVSPAIGLLVYNTEDLILNQWNGTEWTEVGGGGGLGLLDDALMTSTLTSVVDKENTASPLKLSTDLVSVGSTLQISTDDTTYIDAEDSLGNNRFTISRVVGQQEVNVDFASNPTDGATKVGAIRTYQDGVNLSDAISVEKNGQATFTERVKIEADSTATTQTTAVIQAIGTNSGIALVPNGTGAITASIPDGTATGGNARGSNAVDLQSGRTLNTQVASGVYSFIGGGLNNTADAEYSGIVGGAANVITNGGRRGFIGGGDSNTVSSSFSPNAIISGTLCVASGGQSIAGGYSSVASGSRSVALGLFGTASGGGAFAMGGTANGSLSVTFGGNSLNSYVFTHGDNASSGLYGSLTKSSGGFTSSPISNNQRAQSQSLIARREADLISTGTTILSLDGTGTTNLIVPESNNRIWNVKISTIAVVTVITGTATGVSVGDSYMQDDTLLFKKVGGTSSVVGVNNTNIIADISMGTASMGYSAGASQELALTFTAPTFAGGGSVTVRVVSKVSLVEVAW
jgi:hypothetical protein